MRRLGFAGGLLALLGCHDGGPAPATGGLVSEHFDYRARPGAPAPCPDVLDALEEDFALVQGELGFAWPAGRRIVYDRFADSADFAAHAGCPRDAAGCTMQTTVESPEDVNRHELVHAYLFPSGQPPLVLVEGVAVALSCQSRILADPKPTTAWADLIVATRRTPEIYSAGAWLVGYLLGAFPPAKLTELYASLHFGASLAEVDAAFVRVYGRAAGALWGEALSEDHARDQCLWECSRPALDLAAGALPTAEGCARSYVARPFSLASETTVSLTTTAADLMIGPCGGVAPPATWTFGEGGARAIYRLPASTYFLAHSTFAGSIALDVGAPSLLGAACADVTTEPAPFQKNTYVAVPRAPSPWFLALPDAPAATLTVVSSYAPGESALLCPSCNPAACVAPSKLTGHDRLMLLTSPSAAFSEYTRIVQ